MTEILREMRAFRMDAVEVRAAQGERAVISGHAAVFNQISDDLGGFREMIQPGAFEKTLKEDDPRALWNHNRDHLLGRASTGTLRLWEDEAGLAFEIDPPNTQIGRDLVELIKRGDVDAMSFGFITISDRWSNGLEGTLRTLVEVRLFDVSPVTFPAYPQTSAELQMRAQQIASEAAKGQEPDETDTDQAQARLDIQRKRVQLAEK